MTARRKTFALGAGLVAAIVLAVGLLGPAAVSADSPPAVLYGKGLTPGQTVSAWIGGKLCASTTVDGNGEWAMQISDTNSCGPTGGAAIAFQLDGKDVTASPAATFAIGGVPSDIANGYKFSAAQATATATATATASPTAAATSTPAATSPVVTATATATVVPLPPKTGSAGLLDSSTDRGALWLLLTAILVAGAGIAARTTYARRSS
ncbi:MAG: hypothetical protein K1X87_03795 [Dehalococcoidia bacterium]|nr:hypothetical protein [Dehalococcoidia bacterium]